MSWRTAGFAKVLPFTKVNFANFVSRYQGIFYYNFCPLSDPVKRPYFFVITKFKKGKK